MIGSLHEKVTRVEPVKHRLAVPALMFLIAFQYDINSLHHLLLLSNQKGPSHPMRSPSQNHAPFSSTPLSPPLPTGLSPSPLPRPRATAKSSS